MQVFTIDFWKGLWTDFTEYLDDWPVRALKGVLQAVLEVFQSIDPPEFVTQYQLGDVLAPVMPYIGFFLAQAGLTEAMTLISAAIAFRAVRKVVTFGIW